MTYFYQPTAINDLFCSPTLPSSPPPPPSSTVPPKLSQTREEDRRTNFTVVQGRGVVLPCRVEEGDPPPTFTWFKDGGPVSPVDVRYFVRQDGSLEIFSADRQDTARYKCVASNVAGEVEKDMFLFVQGTGGGGGVGGGGLFVLGAGG